MLFKERLLFIGVGQAGGNITDLFEKKGYNTLYINTSSEDLSTLDGDVKKRYKIPSGTGCSKNKEKAKKYLKKNADGMLKHIESNFVNSDIVFFVFSAGGGTGAGLSPALLDALSQMNPDKKYGAIMVMPSKKESTICLKNAVGTYADVTAIQESKSLFVLHNEKGDILQINKRFTNLFNNFIVSASNADRRGNIDGDEMETLLTSKGASVIVSLHEDEEGCLTLENEVYPEFTYGCGAIGLSVKSDCEKVQELLEDTMGIPDVYFNGYNDTHNIAIVTEMNYADEMIGEFQEVIKERKEGKKSGRSGGAVVIKNIFEDEQPSVESKNKSANHVVTQKAKKNISTKDLLSKWS